MTDAEKVRANRLRRTAHRQGLALRKSRTRDPRAIDYGRYMLVDLFTNAVFAGTAGTGRPNLTLDEVETYLTEERDVAMPGSPLMDQAAPKRRRKKS